MIQLDFFADDDISALKAEVKRLKESNEMEILEKYICNGSYAGQQIHK